MAEFWMEKRVVGENPSGAAAQAFVGIDPHAKRALMIVTAYGTSTSVGGSRHDAGILVTVTGRSGGVTSVAKSNSFCTESADVTYNASVPFTMVVEANAVAQIFANVDPVPAGGGSPALSNYNTRVELHVVALDI